MDSLTFGIAIVAAAGFLGVIVHLIRERLADMEETGEISAKARSTGTTEDAKSGDSLEYGSIDCFDDCMRAFRWQSREGAECARACGLNQT